MNVIKLVKCCHCNKLANKETSWEINESYICNKCKKDMNYYKMLINVMRGVK